MTAVALDRLQAVAAAGGVIRLERDMLRLSASTPLPEELRMRVRQHKAEIVELLSRAEPANDPAPDAPAGRIVAGLPREIADGVRDILSTAGAQGIPPQRWTGLQLDAASLVEDGWARQALELGWTPADLFGCDQRAPWHRLDRAGLVLLIGGHEVVDLDPDTAALRTSTESILRFRRKPPARPPVALLWELLIPAQATGPPIRAVTADLSKGRMAATFLADPAAILTTTTPRRRIMAVSTLRAVRSEASDIAVPVAALATGDPSGGAVLALDLGKPSGWAVRTPDGVITSGTAGSSRADTKVAGCPTSACAGGLRRCVVPAASLKSCIRRSGHIGVPRPHMPTERSSVT